MFSSEREGVRAVYRSQASVSQNRLGADDHLKHTQIDTHIHGTHSEVLPRCEDKTEKKVE